MVWRISALILLWTLFGAAPVVTDLFGFHHLGALPSWDEQARFALAMLGYCTVGGYLFAVTGQRGIDNEGNPYPTALERLGRSILPTIAFSALALLLILVES